MCGIVTLAHPERRVDATRAEAAAFTQTHRGPDGVGRWQARHGRVAMAHARLAVLDREGGGQPFVDRATGCALCFNGEIYNHAELRRELAAGGVRFRTRSDTEVLLQAFLRWGPECLGRLDGMYAFTLFDPRDDTLWLARDPLGIKPLYWSLDDGELWVTSELRSLALARRPEPRPDRRGLLHYLVIGYALAPATLLDGVQQLPQGHLGVFRRGHLEIRRHTDLADAARGRAGAELGEADALAQLESLLSASLERQRVADVKVGAFLSGGVDSTLLASLAAARPGADLETFTMAFDQPGYSEAARAARSAAQLGLPHRTLRLGADELRADLRDPAWASDAPIFDGSFLPTRALCRSVREHVTVAISGDGADELFLGYETHRADALAARLRALGLPQAALAALAERLPVRFGKLTRSYKLRSFARAAGRPAPEAHCGWRELGGEATLRGLLAPPLDEAFEDLHPRHVFRAAFERVAGADLLTRMSYVDCETWLANDILVKADRASMAHGLEVRVPYLGLEVARFALGLPDALKFRLHRPKRLLRGLLAQKLPDYPKRAAKQGFGAPLSEWLAGPLGFALDGLAADDGPLAEWLRPSALAALAEAHRCRRSDHGHLLWGLVVLSGWWERLRSERKTGAPRSGRGGRKDGP